MKTILHIVGARPQFVKAAPVSRALAAQGLREILVHTGQHYDWAMSAAFFEGLNIPEPVHNLGVGSASHGAQTGRMLESLEAVMLEEEPDVVLVHGDTNSTVAGALAAAKLHISVAHVEAGLRSFNRRMPEEINRVITDHISEVLFAPTDRAVANLLAEGLTRGVIRTGDVMFDQAVEMSDLISEAQGDVLSKYGVAAGDFAFVTVHRPENTDDQERWDALLGGFERIAATGLKIVWPYHPRTKSLLQSVSNNAMSLVEPMPYLDAQVMVSSARVVITDSGGLQKEAAFHRTPCITVRDQTEWIELVDAGVNKLVSVVDDGFVEYVFDARWPEQGVPHNLYGDGASAYAIVEALAADI